MPSSVHRRRWLIGTSVAATLLIVIVLGALLASPRSAPQLVQRGVEALSNGDSAHALQYAEQAVKSSPQLSAAWRLLADAAGRSNQYDRAIDALHEYANQRPDDAGPLAIRLGRDWMLRNRIRHASQALHLAETYEVHATEALKLQAQIAAVTGHARETTRCLIELMKRGSVARGDLLLVTSVAPHIDDPKRLDAILKADPDNKRPLLAFALNELNLNHYDDAERLLLTITNADPDDFEAQGALAELYAQSKPEKFYNWHQNLPPIVADDARIWSARGRWLADAGRTEAAIRCLYEARKREPEQLGPTSLLGQLLKSINETELGKAFSERSHHLQQIVDFNARMNEPRANEFVIPMIEELVATGRFWEAWGWCVVGEQSRSGDREKLKSLKTQIERTLKPDLPRTQTESLPGTNFDWNRFALPNWYELKPADQTSEPASTPTVTVIRFEDRAEEVGIAFRYVNSYVPAQGRRIFESMGGGVAVLDFDIDGWPDLYFPQGNRSPTKTSEGPSDSLYRNQYGQRFVNVTPNAAIHETSYSQGVAAGDFDNDGFPDIYVANLGRNRLYHNNGDGTFSDVTEEAGLKQEVWTVSCAIADLNGDGLPELFDVNYVQGDDLLTGYCTDSHGRRTVCRPTVYDPTTDTVCLNLGDGRFQEQQKECGLDLPQGMGLGLVIADFNDDDRLDVFIANDMTANYLLINETMTPDQPLHFRDEAVLRNVALDHNGLAQACMGIACADINRDAAPDLFVTNFAQESNTLYLSQPGGFYQDRTQAAGLRKPSFDPLGFGTQFIDADNDGWHDLAVVNGHIDNFIDQPFRMKAQFFRGNPENRFTEVPPSEAGPLFEKPRLGRGMAFVDWNKDGRTDFIATDLEDSVILAENRTTTQNRSLSLRFIGTKSNRDAIGTKIRVTVSSNDVRYFQLTAGDGYECSNERILRIGSGDADQIENIEVRWPSGQISRAHNILLDHEWLVIEGLAEWLPLR